MPGPLEGCLRRWIQLCTLSWEDPLEKGTATNSSILAWRIPWTVHRVEKSQTQLRDFHFHFSFLHFDQKCSCWISWKCGLCLLHGKWDWILFLAVANTLCAQMTEPTLCLFSLHGEPLPWVPQETLLPALLAFLLLAFSSPSPSTFGLFFCFFPLWFLDSVQTLATPVPRICSVCSVHLNSFFPHWENIAHLFANWKNKKQVLRPIQFHICRLSVCSFE